MNMLILSMRMRMSTLKLEVQLTKSCKLVTLTFFTPAPFKYALISIQIDDGR